MKRIPNIFLIFFLLSSTISCAQNKVNSDDKNRFHSDIIKDSIFENVIKITDNNIVSNGTDFLFDVSISKTVELPIIYVQSEVPLNLLSTIYPDFTKLIVITPNWTYYKGISNQKLPEGISCAEPMASSIIYEFNRENGRILKDSLIIMGGFPKMKFSENRTLKNNEKEFYYTESYGSTCCPKDLQWDNKPTREEFISNFQYENNSKIVDTYKKITGKDGEVTFFYTLKGLPNLMKLKFILERDFYRIINRQNKDIVKTPRIYTPTVINISNSLKKI